MTGRKKVTIKDVARAAGFSPATVSLVYNEKGEVAAATRERVLKVGAELGYKPGWISKVFRSGKTNVLGVVVTHRNTRLWEATYSQYYRGIIAGAALEALEHGYSITALKAEPDGILLGPLIPDGLIVVDPVTDDPLVLKALQSGLAVVAAGGWASTQANTPVRSVTYRVQEGVALALETLSKQGPQRPAFIRGPVLDVYTSSSENAYLDWCTRRSISPLVFVLDEGQTAIAGARKFLKQAHREGVDSAYCINESYGGAIAAAAGELGLRIPEDFGIAATADSTSATIDPRLVYLDQNPITLGATLAKMLVLSLTGAAVTDTELAMPLLEKH